MNMKTSAMLLALSCCVGSAVAQQEPSAYEIEMWKAATRLDVPDAYRDYLRAFPGGAFATMAKLSIERAAAGGSQKAPVEGLADKSLLTALYGMETETGSISLRVGDRLNGPGAYTVGWYGAKRQMVVPRGEWVLLAAFDHRYGALQMSTYVFGQFLKADLASALMVTTNTRGQPSQTGPNAVYGAPAARWQGHDECEQATRGSMFHKIDAVQSLRICELVSAVLPDRDPLDSTPGARRRMESSLDRLRVASPRFASRSEVHISDAGRGSISYTRLDTAALGQDRVDWLNAFALLAIQGDGRNIGSDDLSAIGASPEVGVSLPK